MNESLFSKLKQIAVNLFFYLIFNWKIVLPAILLLILLYFIGAGINSCEWKRADKHIKNADNSASNSLILEGERKSIEREANRDLEFIENERKKQNEKINQSLLNVNRPINFNRAVNGSELDRRADEFRRKRANSGGNW